MAVDVVVRPEGRCLTVVHDENIDGVHSVVVDGAELTLLSPSGATRIGALSEEMALLAGSCTVAVVVKMNGPYVADSAKAKLVRHPKH